MYRTAAAQARLSGGTLSTQFEPNNKRPKLNLNAPPTFDSLCKRLFTLSELKSKQLIEITSYDLLFNQCNDMLLYAIQPDVFETVAEQLFQIKALEDQQLLRPGVFNKLHSELSARLLQAQGFRVNPEVPGKANSEI